MSIMPFTKAAFSNNCRQINDSKHDGILSGQASDGWQESKDTKGKTVLHGALNHVLLFGALICSLLFAHAAASCAEDWDNNHKKADSGTVEAGGTRNAPFKAEIKRGYDKIAFGHAEITGTGPSTAQANYNRGIVAAGGSGSAIYGGVATNTGTKGNNSTTALRVEASNNSITMLSGSSLPLPEFSFENLPPSYTGSINIVTSLVGSYGLIDYTSICGGYASIQNCNNIWNSATTHDNIINLKNTLITKYTTNSDKIVYNSIIGGACILDVGTTNSDNNRIICKDSKGINNNIDIIICGFSSSCYSSSSNNCLEIENGTFQQFLIGGFARGKTFTTASNNEVTLKNCKLVSGEIIGGFADSTTSVIETRRNKLTLIDSEINSSLIGGYIADGSYCEGVTQFHAKATTIASDNILHIKGGKYKGCIYGVYYNEYIANSSYIKNNTIAIYKGISMPKFAKNTVIYGCNTKYRSSFTNNNLEFHEVKGLSAANIRNFNNFIFELPDMKAGETIIDLNDNDGGYRVYKLDENNKLYNDRCSVQYEYIKDNTTDIIDTTVGVQKVGKLTGADGGEFKIGDKVYLLKNDNGIKTKNCVLKPVAVKGLPYTLELKADSTSIYLTRTR